MSHGFRCSTMWLINSLVNSASPKGHGISSMSCTTSTPSSLRLSIPQAPACLLAPQATSSQRWAPGLRRGFVAERSDEGFKPRNPFTRLMQFRVRVHVLATMLRDRHHLQVLNPIIGLDAVAMMDQLILREQPSEMCLHHDPVLHHVTFAIGRRMRGLIEIDVTATSPNAPTAPV